MSCLQTKGVLQLQSLLQKKQSQHALHVESQSSLSRRCFCHCARITSSPLLVLEHTLDYFSLHKAACPCSCLLDPLEVEQQAGASTMCCSHSLWVPWLQARLTEAGVVGAGAERIVAGHLGAEGLAGELAEAVTTPRECRFPGFVQPS